ncbi:MAG: Rha family transcriptional regulator [Azoarcus sp.]|jgi:Rha family phage regulatory protein|nr:Rha family transcriptional regulator [Azoarcus sp.]
MTQKITVPASLPVIDIVDGRPVTTSSDVATVFGKDHAKVLRDIRSLLDSLPDERKANFGLTTTVINMPNGATRQDPAYTITRDGFTLLAMGFTGKRALAFKLAYIDAFNAMEAELLQKKIPPALTVPPRMTLAEYIRLRRKLLDVDHAINRLFDALAAARIECTSDEIERGFIRISSGGDKYPAKSA